jgi:hypothetical protein
LLFSSWVKHDLILYQEKPYAAEAGQGGGPEPPKHYSYVEPNLEFWNESLSLVEWLKKLSHYDPTFASQLQSITDIGHDCLFHLKSIPGFQFKSIPLLFRKQYLKKKGVPLSSSGLLAL